MLGDREIDSFIVLTAHPKEARKRERERESFRNLSNVMYCRFRVTSGLTPQRRRATRGMRVPLQIVPSAKNPQHPVMHRAKEINREHTSLQPESGIQTHAVLLQNRL